MSDLDLKTALSDMSVKMHDKIEAGYLKASELSDQKGAEHKAAIAEMDASIKSLNDQIIELAQKHSVPVELIEAKSFGQQILDSDSIKSFIAGENVKGRIELKNTIVNSGNASSVHDQMAGAIPGAFRQLTVMPTVMQGVASSNIIYYSKEASFVNGTAITAEGAAKPESTLTFAEVNVSIKTHPTYLRVSKQALDDSTFLASYIERRLRHAVNNKVEDYIINNTTDGWLATANNTVTSPLLTVDLFGLANKMKMEVIGADYEPSFFYMNPSDWGDAETSRRASGDNAFVAASGAVAYVNNGLTPLLWGLPVVLSNNIPVGSIVCKSMDADMYVNRESVIVEMFEQDGDNVTTNLITVRAETRGAELVFTPLAIRTGDITGITA
jgi:HK97 family phage major capsid protein